jgi:hypothetical protein
MTVSVFIALLGLVAVAIGLYVPRYHQAGAGSAWYLPALALAFFASLAVLVAGNAVVFLVAWESMTLFSYLVVLRHHRRAGVARAAFLSLALGEAGFALIVAAFAILATQTGMLDLAGIAGQAGHVSAEWRDAAFVLALVGFGFKAGLVPLHIWLPEAHPAAPADGSAFLSGLVLKLGVFGIALFAFRARAWRPGLVGDPHDGPRRHLGRARDPVRPDGARPEALPRLLEYRERRRDPDRARRRHDLRRPTASGRLAPSSCSPASITSSTTASTRRSSSSKPAWSSTRPGRATWTSSAA